MNVGSRAIALLVSSAALAGCVSTATIPVSQKTATDMRGQPVAPVARKTPDFAAMTPGKAMFGLIGAGLMISEGNKIVADNKVADPAANIATELSSMLAQKHGASSSAASVTVDSDDVAKIAQSAPGARFIVDVQTVNWSLLYFPTNWARYRVLYTAKARIVDTQAKSVVAESFCKHIPEDASQAPSYDDLLANEGALLKTHLAQGAKSCLDQLKAALAPA